MIRGFRSKPWAEGVAVLIVGTLVGCLFALWIATSSDALAARRDCVERPYRVGARPLCVLVRQLDP